MKTEKKELLKWVYHKCYGSEEDKRESIESAVDDFALALLKEAEDKLK